MSGMQLLRMAMGTAEFLLSGCAEPGTQPARKTHVDGGAEKEEICVLPLMLYMCCASRSSGIGCTYIYNFDLTAASKKIDFSVAGIGAETSMGRRRISRLARVTLAQSI